MIKMIVLPKKLGLDEMLSLWVLKNFGERVFPGVTAAKIVNRKTDIMLDPTEFMLNSNGLDQAASLLEAIVAVCRCEGDPVLGKFLRFYGGDVGNFFAVAFRHIARSETPTKVIAWGMQTLDALFADWDVIIPTVPLSAESENALARIARIGPMPAERTVKLRRSNGMEIAVEFVVGDGPFELRTPIDLVVAMDNDGTMITVLSRFSLRDVARILRVEELLRENGSERNVLIARRMWFEFSNEGIEPLAPAWYYQRSGDGNQHIITTGIKTPFTRLQVGEVVTLIRHAMDNRFQAQREHHCLKCRCTASIELPCPWHHWMLSKCRLVRNAQQKERDTARQARV